MKKTVLTRILIVGAAAVLVSHLLAYVVPLPKRLREAPSTVIHFEDGSPAYVFLSPDDKWRMEARLDEVDPDYIKALLRFEDKRFNYHPGVDPIAIARAAYLNLKHGRVMSGGSTLTMQLVRLVEPRPRTLRSKALEALRAVQLEMRLSKTGILEAYMAFTSFGRNVEGVRAACYAYFGHGVEDLSAEEIATLLAVPQRPNERYPSAENADRLESARNEIVAWLLEEGVVPLAPLGSDDANVSTDDLLQQVRSAPVPSKMKPLPRRAPHAAFWLKHRHPEMTRIETTLDAGSQRVAEKLLADAQDDARRKGVRNGAMVLVEHRTGRVRALVGNFDFFDGHGGQIVGFDEPRSPGSALKPLIYAMAIDRGLALPEFLVADIPVRYGGYAPDNYDGRFAGLVSMEDALSRSLNIPFVQLLSQVGVEQFTGALRASGVEGLSDVPGYYGLSAAIGAVEVTPLELSGLFAALANHGRAPSLVWLRGEEESGSGPHLFSKGAAYLTRRALARRDRPDFPERRRFSGAPSNIHWKTGTSYGHRDAWACGSGPRYTGVVWLGNFDNRPSVDLVGAEAAGPLLFDLLEAVSDRSRLDLPDGPTEDLRPVEVCSYSGHLPSTACESTQTVLALTHKVPTKVCPYHTSVDIDRVTGLALNPSCRAGHDFETRSFLVWPATIRRWLGQRYRWLPSPPALAADCRVVDRHEPPAILSPPRGQVMALLPGVPESEQEVPLVAESSGKRLSWFVDGKFLGSVEAERRLWWKPSPGHHEFLVMDESGRSARRSLRVRKGM